MQANLGGLIHHQNRPSELKQSALQRGELQLVPGLKVSLKSVSARFTPTTLLRCGRPT